VKPWKPYKMVGPGGSNLQPMDYESFDRLIFFRSMDLKEVGRNYE